jgi:hypothetical protein
LRSGAEPQGQISDSSVSLTGGATGTGARWERGGKKGKKQEGERERKKRVRWEEYLLRSQRQARRCSRMRRERVRGGLRDTDDIIGGSKFMIK